MNILKMHGTDICSLGMVETPDDPAYEEVVFIDKPNVTIRNASFITTG